MTGASIGDAVPGTSLKEAIAERWVSLSIDSWPGAARPLLSAEKDPFRNPVGSTLRSNLHILTHEVLGELSAGVLRSEAVSLCDPVMPVFDSLPG